MSTHAFVGRISADDPHTIRVRYVHFDGVPNHILPTLRTIWADTCHRDTTTLVQAVHAHDWASLDATVTTGEQNTFGDTPVPGIGLAIDTDQPTPLSTVALDHLHRLDARWIYLIDPATDTVAVHTPDTGTMPLGLHHLAT